MKKKKLNNIIFVYTISFLCVAVCFYPILPYILNYPPNSLNNSFQKGIDMGLLYIEQYILLMAVCFLFGISILIIKLKQLNKIYTIDFSKYLPENEKVIYKLLNLPYTIFIIFLIIPSLVIITIYAISEGSINIGTIKIALSYIMMQTICALINFTYCKNLVSNILKNMFINKNYIKKTYSLKNKIFVIIMPMVIMSLIFMTLLGYSRIIEQKSEYMAISNKLLLDEALPENHYSYDELYSKLKNIELINETDDIFIIYSPDNYNTLDKTPLSNFFIKYTIEQSEKNNNRTFDTYGIDSQGITKKITIDNIEAYVGIIFNIDLSNTLNALVLSIFLLSILICIVLYYVSSSLAEDTKKVADSLKSIVNNEVSHVNNIQLPITSNDEIAELVIEFNEIQKITIDHINTIQNSQEQLVEQERLASLGQMIGGIAHNLKTPIMSISGAAEGINDLINEFDASIGNPVVTEQDFHDIAKDMMEWTTKIKSYTEYMSDVITAVKGQATNLSNETEISFTITELFKRVNILMKHELKKAVVYLNISTNIDENTVINGDINSLVQVINNMISNAIQCYNGIPEKEIDLTASKQDNNIVISIQDYGPGLPKIVRDKLFKEMVTTKGKNGTGLGLYMSYSNIKAHFNGNITFETKTDVGTIFNIIIPI